MGNLQTCGDVPVNVAHVVVVLVFAQVGQINARTAQQGSVVALQQAVKAADHGPFQAAQDALGTFRHRVGHECDRCRFGLEQAEHGVRRRVSRVLTAWRAAVFWP